MINFFRRIRKKLADDKKPMKYMRYAIGEILLVVIGILIALQVNNWNQNRSKAQKEKIMLIELKENLEFNIERFQSAISWEEDRIKGIKKILEYIENEKPWNDTIQYEIKQFRLIEEFHIS